MFKFILTIALAVFSAMSQANWTVDNNNSRVNFVSVKKSHIAESHHFKTVSGLLSANGKFELEIDLSSVETGIAIRNQRMLQHLFNIDKFTTANLNAQIDPAIFDSVPVGSSTTHQLTAILSLHGVSKELNLTVVVTKPTGDTLLINSLSPVIINSNDFMLTAGIDALRDLAKLANISYAVPVTFSLQLKK